ncbi:MAG TPA: ATP-binding protein [Solirubrobacteraceae bacterium]
MTAGATERQVVAVAAALERLAVALPSQRATILAVCDADGRPDDLLVRDRQGRIAVPEGVPEHRRPELTGIVDLTAGQRRWTPRELADPRQPTEIAGAAERDALVHVIAEHSPLPLVLADRAGIIRYASGFMDEFGYAPDELVGDRLLDYVHPDGRQRLAHVQERLALDGRASAVIDIRWRRRDGGYSNVEARMRRAGDPQGSLAGGIVIGLRALPGPWAAPADMVAAVHRHRVFADASDCGVAIVSGAEDSLGVVLDATARLGRIVGATAGQLVGSSLTSLVADRDVSRLHMALTSVRTRGRPYQLQVTLNEAIGGRRSAEIAVTPDAAGSEPSELIVRVRDVTEELRLVSELSRTVEHLNETNHELAEFARITAHDLSAPLLALSRLVDLISREGEESDDSATIDAIRNAIKRMRSMVDGVMGYAQSAESMPRRGTVNLEEVLHRVLETLAEEIADRNALVTLGELPTVSGDGPQLERVLLNLTANALKYSGIGPPRVRVEASHQPDSYLISVSDEGIGVPQADRTRIFELFARSEVAAAGRGIGLATSRRIVELHGGQIWVEPNDRNGSTFRFTLPCGPSGPAGQDQGSAHLSMGSLDLGPEEVRIGQRRGRDQGGPPLAAA